MNTSKVSHIVCNNKKWFLIKDIETLYGNKYVPFIRTRRCEPGVDYVNDNGNTYIAGHIIQNKMFAKKSYDIKCKTLIILRDLKIISPKSDFTQLLKNACPNIKQNYKITIGDESYTVDFYLPKESAIIISSDNDLNYEFPSAAVQMGYLYIEYDLSSYTNEEAIDMIQNRLCAVSPNHIKFTRDKQTNSIMLLKSDVNIYMGYSRNYLKGGDLIKFQDLKSKLIKSRTSIRKSKGDDLIKLFENY